MDVRHGERESQATEGPATIYSVGHSNHTTEEFLALLKRHEIDLLCDVRSHPASAFAFQFNEPQLRADLEAAGLKYLFLGHQLGGRPVGDEYFDDEGHVRYDVVAESAEFLAGIKRIECEAAQRRVAMMCSEEDPAGCHRRLLVARVLASRGTGGRGVGGTGVGGRGIDGRGIDVRHIRADGRVQSESDVAAEQVQRKLGNQRTLFDVAEVAPWRSIRSVLHKRRQPTFSAD
ncbi:MAG: DUF488 domain-containing protein [Pirellulales bacterium]